MKETPAPLGALRTITYGTLLVILIGYLLVVGQGLILPILIALISVYVMGSADTVLGNLRGCGRCPRSCGGCCCC